MSFLWLDTGREEKTKHLFCAVDYILLLFRHEKWEKHNQEWYKIFFLVDGWGGAKFGTSPPTPIHSRNKSTLEGICSTFSYGAGLFTSYFFLTLSSTHTHPPIVLGRDLLLFISPVTIYSISGQIDLCWSKALIMFINQPHFTSIVLQKV